jgi:small subunit ribosomal protein S17
MLSFTATNAMWWNFASERKVRQSVMMGGHRAVIRNASTHKFYFKKFRKNAFPNRTRLHWNVSMTGVTRQRPRRMTWPYDLTSMIFNRPNEGSDKIGYCVSTGMAKTAVIATNHLVYYPKYNQRVSRVSRFFAHDEDMAVVEGDLVHIKMCRKISRYKNYFIFSILEPNIEARERLKIGLRAVPPPLFGYPVARRIVKLNLTKPENVKQKTAAVVQEHVQEFYRYTGSIGTTRILRHSDVNTVSVDEVNALVAPNAPPSLGDGFDGSASEQGEELLLTGGQQQQEGKSSRSQLASPDDSSNNAPEALWMKRTPADQYDYKNFVKSP